MPPSTHATTSFPAARLASASGGLPVEVTLIARLGRGEGDRLFAGAQARQQAHADYVDGHDEPSARLGASDFARGDHSALYSFAVGAKGHPFHRHAGPRMFVAVSGSGGTCLRFCTSSPAQLEQDPAEFLRALRQVEIPPDCLFSVRFGGGTWHQFAPLSRDGRHPAFFALSCHPDELGGELPDSVRAQVLANQATIPALTELLPGPVLALLEAEPPRRMPAIALALDTPPDSSTARFDRRLRGLAGKLRAGLARRRPTGFLQRLGGMHAVTALATLPQDSLLRSQLDGVAHHEDMFRLELEPERTGGLRAAELLERLLDGFVEHPPASVSRMMRLRNLLVRPLGLRTSSLGCPVSSLLARGPQPLFRGRHPVLAQSVDADDRLAQVILGADDKHLQFRSCVAVRIIDTRRIELSMGTRVRCKNLFGHGYMALIERVHRHYVSPLMLATASEYAFGAAEADALIPAAVFHSS